MKQLPSWREVLSQKRFLILLILGYILAFTLSYVSPLILTYVQARQGIVLNDILLRQIPAIDCSNLIFFVLYLEIAWMFFRSYQTPSLHLQLTWMFLLFYTFRFITIWFTPLEPPIGWINLQDPFAKIFIYDNATVSKDLFFSGHVGFAFAIYLLFPNRIEKIWGMVVVCIIATLVLIQHVHYTIDVMAAPFFGYLSYWLAKRIAIYATQSNKNNVSKTQSLEKEVNDSYCKSLF